MVLIVLLIAFVVGGCTVAFVLLGRSTFEVYDQITRATGNEVTAVNVRIVNGQTTVDITLAPGVTPLEGRRILCEVAIPAIAKAGLVVRGVYVYTAGGGLAASTDQTPCPAPTSETPGDGL